MSRSAHEQFSLVEGELAAKIAEIQSALQLALLKAQTDTLTISSTLATATTAEGAALRQRQAMFERKLMLAVGADVILAKVYKDLK